ncbi:hypothetical protein, partial [Crossiella equi]|uniref:hypothetical protein n=1 Tax=Crossiella equi TaxID=130796 RepID=UPI001302D539
AASAVHAYAVQLIPHTLGSSRSWNSAPGKARRYSWWNCARLSAGACAASYQLRKHERWQELA